VTGLNESINGDLSRRAIVNIHDLEWQPSPGGDVLRKRLHLVGAPETGQVTSVVRYPPGAMFPEHGHPGGEEILVLEGVFSDERGDWPAGTYLLNPEGFRHAPYSHSGCVLFVKLRQYPGPDRQHLAIDTNELPWVNGVVPGVESKQLYQQQGYTDSSWLERWQPDASCVLDVERLGLELYVLGGAMNDHERHYAEGTWLRLPHGTSLELHSESGCTLYAKRGGFGYLRSA
jgi:anti-sigma factor ChrR (cupin superfamily)